MPVVKVEPHDRKLKTEYTRKAVNYYTTDVHCTVLRERNEAAPHYYMGRVIEEDN